MARKKVEQELELPYEEAMKRLEDVVRRLEEGDVPLEEAIGLYQEGVQLARLCGRKLDLIEAQITLLLEENGELKEKPFMLEGEV
ncbi:exodeoxyribonuclease VII small subunit [Brevibacillus fluminis]|uniref:Exodeoxyribonuclease 7 small subunit n=1 Tax=Brevibacillus fluminis TaxID=511487 RepID=A0A3M8D149_9BACL|nr:exodeoxyribonuclease VII small subunit [Brevibacillus fluminis]RNB81137.1 exodeoxyribonuclease VII small subunit [Brevibacillus fluminis]